MRSFILHFNILILQYNVFGADRFVRGAVAQLHPHFRLNCGNSSQGLFIKAQKQVNLTTSLCSVTYPLPSHSPSHPHLLLPLAEQGVRGAPEPLLAQSSQAA